MIESLFPPGVVALRAGPELADEALRPEESAGTERMSEARRREYAMGRALARRALVRLGLAEAAIPRGSDRAPRWPEGVVGSITHSDDLCAVAVARRDPILGLGIDVESDRPLSERAARRICTAAERAHLAALPPLPSGSWEKLVFSAKESFYKCYYAIARTKLGFRDAEVVFAPGDRCFEVHLRRADAPAAFGARRFSGRFALAAPFVATGVALRRGDPGVAPDA